MLNLTNLESLLFTMKDEYNKVFIKIINCFSFVTTNDCYINFVISFHELAVNKKQQDCKKLLSFLKSVIAQYSSLI